MFTLSHKFNAFLGENKKRPKNQKVTTNNEGKRNKETRGGGGKQKEKSTEKLQIKKIVAMEMIMLFIRRFQLKKKKN